MAALNDGRRLPPARSAGLRAAAAAVLCTLLACAPRPPTVEVLLVGGSVVQDAGGQVQVVRGETATPARRGEALETGDVVRTGPAGQAVLRLEDGKVEVLVFENSEVRVGSIFVVIGKVVVRVLEKVKDEFKTESEYAVAEPEKTEFLVEFGPDRNYRCAVIEGSVEVYSPTGEWPRATLSRGEVAAGRPGRPIEERALAADEYNALIEQVNAVERAYRPNSARLAVPDVTGLDEAEARRVLAAAGLPAAHSEGRVTGRAPLGTVLEQSPRAGSRLAAGGGVRLVVEAEPTTVPRVTGLPFDDAEATLTAALLRTGDVRREITGSRAEGEVLRQEPDAGREVTVGSAVDLVLEAPSVVVPRLGKLDRRRAAAQLHELGLQVRTETRMIEGGTEGVVLDQRPQGGTRVEPGSTVEVTVAERGTRVPDLVGTSERRLRGNLERQDLVVGQVSSRPVRGTPGTIVEQTPRAGDLVRPGTPVHVTVATHCTVPDVELKKRDDAVRTIERAELVARVAGRYTSPQHWVVSQEPKAGARVECGSTVAIRLQAPID